MLLPACGSPRLVFSSVRFAPAVLLAAAVLASPASAKPPGGVPFKADVTVREELRPSAVESCPGLVGMTTGRGTASHLGAITLAASDCVLPLPGGGFEFFNGTLRLTAANGDELIGTYATPGPVTLVPTSSAPLTVTLSTPYVITGGTGRFRNATGEGMLTGTLVLDLGTFTAEGSYRADGTISY